MRVTEHAQLGVVVGYDVKVSTDDVASKAASLAREAEDLSGRLSALTNDMSALASSWSGQASSSFQQLFANWRTTAEQTRAALADIGTSLSKAATRYNENETKSAPVSTAKSFSGLR